MIGSESKATTDQQLMERLLEGESEALGEIYLRHGGMVRSAIVRAAPEISLAELDEVTQDVFLKLKDLSTRYEEKAKLKSWIYTVAYKTGQTWRRKTWLRRKLLGQHKGEPVGMAMQPDQSLEQGSHLRQIASQVLQKLPPKQREVLILHAVEGFSGDEIAKMLGISSATVRTWMHRSRKNIQGSVNAQTWASALEGRG